MAILAPDMQDISLHFSVSAMSDYWKRGEAQADSQPPDFFSGNLPVSDLAVGSTRYPLRFQLAGNIYPASDGFEYCVAGFENCYVGRGTGRAEARDDWYNWLHATFQRLIRTQPFEREPDDALLWEILQGVIDVPKYRKTTPIAIRQIGEVRYGDSQFPTQIYWSNGNREHVTLQQMPASFASLQTGQWFEAVVHRDPIDGHMIHTSDLHAISRVCLMSPERQDEYWDSLPTSRDLPGATINWGSLDG